MKEPWELIEGLMNFPNASWSELCGIVRATLKWPIDTDVDGNQMGQPVPVTPPKPTPAKPTPAKTKKPKTLAGWRTQPPCATLDNMSEAPPERRARPVRKCTAPDAVAMRIVFLRETAEKTTATRLKPNDYTAGPKRKRKPVAAAQCLHGNKNRRKWQPQRLREEKRTQLQLQPRRR
jgi:hypothetical protein